MYHTGSDDCARCRLRDAAKAVQEAKQQRAETKERGRAAFLQKKVVTEKRL